MGKIAENREADLVQHLNVALQDIIYKDDKSPLHEVKGIFITTERNDEQAFLVRSLSGPIATFSLAELPGCCGVLVSYHSEVLEKYRKQGLGTALLQVRMMAARASRYGCLMATVDKTNTAETEILIKTGWIKMKEFRNPRTSNVIEVYSTNL